MIVIFGFIIFLLSLYLFTREDFVFARKNISVEELFDSAFLTALIALFFARSIFVVLHFKTTYINPLVFFLVPYFPGLDVSGTIIGSALFLFWIAKRRKMPLGHVMDVFSVSFFYAFAASLLGYGLIGLFHRQFLPGIVESVWAVIAFALAILFGSILMKSLWKDGSMSCVVVAIISVVVIITRSVIMLLQKPIVLDKELVIILGILLVSGVIGFGRMFLQRSRL